MGKNPMAAAKRWRAKNCRGLPPFPRCVAPSPPHSALQPRGIRCQFDGLAPIIAPRDRRAIGRAYRDGSCRVPGRRPGQVPAAEIPPRYAWPRDPRGQAKWQRKPQQACRPVGAFFHPGSSAASAVCRWLRYIATCEPGNCPSCNREARAVGSSFPPTP
jgi:hypothetical protein